MARHRFDVDGNYLEDTSTSEDIQEVSAPCRLPVLEKLLGVPCEFIYRLMRHPKECQVLMEIGSIGAQLDTLLEHSVEQIVDYHRCHVLLQETIKKAQTNHLWITDSVVRHSAKDIVQSNMALLESRNLSLVLASCSTI
jgi:hypothetical protein